MLTSRKLISPESNDGTDNEDDEDDEQGKDCEHHQHSGIQLVVIVLVLTSRLLFGDHNKSGRDNLAEYVHIIK